MKLGKLLTFIIIFKFLFLIFCLSFISKKIIINNNKLISVIIPTYNREKLIVESIKSVLRQTYSKIEIIVIDDGSTDNTEKEINKLKDKRIKYVKLSQNLGAPYARNIGIKLAKGKYISFQDSDDIYHTNKLKKQMKNILKNKSDFDFCKILVNINSTYRYVIPDNTQEKAIIENRIFDGLLTYGNFISTQSILVKKTFIENLLFDVNMPRLQDYDLVLRLIRNLNVSFTNETLVDLYLQTNSITSSKIKLKLAIQKLLNKDFNLNIEQKKIFDIFLKSHLN